MWVHNEKYITNYVEKVKDIATYIEYEEENKNISYSGFRTENKSVIESDMSTFLVVQLAYDNTAKIAYFYW